MMWTSSLQKSDIVGSINRYKIIARPKTNIENFQCESLPASRQVRVSFPPTLKLRRMLYRERTVVATS